jgi:hypothetical protein
MMLTAGLSIDPSTIVMDRLSLSITPLIRLPAQLSLPLPDD